MKRITKMLIMIVPALSLSLSSFAAATTTPTQPATATSHGVSKEIWLQQFKVLAPPAMCKNLTVAESTKNILSANKITYDKCVPMITKSMNNCLAKFSNSLPAQFDVDQGRKWGEIVGRCSGADFYLNNVTTKVSKI